MKLDDYDFFWTFGNHEPIAMYRRVARRSTGGIEGSALFLEDWHHWFDSEDCVKHIAEAGANILHCRFYKGMGWEVEKHDFPAVREFALRCRRHGIKVLAYLQYSTLYYEMMMDEIPNLEEWCCLQDDGRKSFYGDLHYYRWNPCVNNPEFQQYMLKITRLAVEAGCFDGIMEDNAFSRPCYCPRCQNLFREHLKNNCNPADFGLRNFDHVVLPFMEAIRFWSEIKDPVTREAIRFWGLSNHRLHKMMYDCAKQLNPDFIVSGNMPSATRGSFHTLGGCMEVLNDFDLMVCQSGNEPHMSGDCAINRIRDLMLFDRIGVSIYPVSDSDASCEQFNPGLLLTQLLECRVWGGIPGDRLMLKSDRQTNLNEKAYAERCRLNRQFFKISEQFKDLFTGEEAAEVGVLMSKNSQAQSKNSYLSLMAWQEVLLRKHAPFRLVYTDGTTLYGLDGCRVLLLAGQACLSDADITAIRAFLAAGGTVIGDAQSGDCDELYRLRRYNAFDGMDMLRTPAIETASQKELGWVQKVAYPANGDQLFELIRPAVQKHLQIQAAPELRCRLVNVKGRRLIHFINYSGEQRPLPRITLDGKALEPLYVTAELPEFTQDNTCIESWAAAFLE